MEIRGWIVPPPPLGAIVYYRPTAEELGVINAPIAHRSEETRLGDQLPAMVVGVNDDGTLNLKVFTNNRSAGHWAPCIVQGDEPGCWNWPRVPA